MLISRIRAQDDPKFASGIRVKPPPAARARLDLQKRMSLEANFKKTLSRTVFSINSKTVWDTNSWQI
jgi:hypothetical protein